MAKVTSIKKVSPSFEDVKSWYEQHMSPDVIDFDDPKPYEYVYANARWAGIFQLTSNGAQRLFTKAIPTSIIDIATLTSIYRPGPLAANVDKLYVKAKNGEKFEWKDPRIGEILEKTQGLIIFQEQVMELAEKCAGFPKEECDQVRRAIMKRSISGGAAASKIAKETRDSFVKGCIKNEYAKDVANDLYDKILYFAGYGFNKAHAVAYAIDSYWCAWLMTYYEEDWLCAYLESMSVNDDKRAKAFSEVRALGYTIVPVDIKHATKHWKALPGKQLMPSLTSCKGIGMAALEELDTFRPLTTLENLLWDESGKWRPSKLNKGTLEVLVHIKAFESLEIVGKDRLFKNYNHMHKVVIEHMNDIKKSLKKDPHIGRKRFYELIREYDDIPTLSKIEQAKLNIKHFGSLDVNSLVTTAIKERLESRGVHSIDEWEHPDVYWFCVTKTIPKKTKNGKNYLLLNVMGPAAKSARMFVWSWDGYTSFDPYTIMVGEVNKNDYGFVSSQGKLRILEV